jgi:tetratricopeptide (TPR) repeat protein
MKPKIIFEVIFIRNIPNSSLKTSLSIALYIRLTRSGTGEKHSSTVEYCRGLNTVIPRPHRLNKVPSNVRVFVHINIWVNMNKIYKPSNSITCISIGIVAITVCHSQIAMALSRYRVNGMMKPMTDTGVRENRIDHRYRLGDIQEALAEYDKASQLHSSDAIAYYNRGVAHDESGDYQDAIADYEQAIHLNLNYAKAYSNCGAAGIELGDKQGAISDENQAIQINPNFANAYAIRGLAKAQTGDTQAGLSDLNKAATLAQQQNNQSLYDRVQTTLTQVRP